MSLASPRLPACIGPYRVERCIGAGAMGTVYLAHDRATGSPVALKALPLDRSGAEAQALRARFEREAAGAGRLKHPGIAAVLAAGEDGGLAWIAIEFAPGQDLGRHVAAGALLAPGIVVDIGAQIAAALAHAHRQGVVHRDLKPANVIFDPATGAARLTDFGIARIAEASRTRTGVVLGTPAYMSPEQIAGLAVDARSDLYSLGVLLFQLLCARLPHEAPTLGGLLARIAGEPAPDIRSLRPELPETLAQAVAQSLAKRPEGRPADGDTMAQMLRKLGPSVNSSRTEPRHNSSD